MLLTNNPQAGLLLRRAAAEGAAPMEDHRDAHRRSTLARGHRHRRMKSYGWPLLHRCSPTASPRGAPTWRSRTATLMLEAVRLAGSERTSASPRRLGWGTPLPTGDILRVWVPVPVPAREPTSRRRNVTGRMTFTRPDAGPGQDVRDDGTPGLHALSAGQDNSTIGLTWPLCPGETTRCAQPYCRPHFGAHIPRHDRQDQRRPPQPPALGRTHPPAFTYTSPAL